MQTRYWLLEVLRIAGHPTLQKLAKIEYSILK